MFQFFGEGRHVRIFHEADTVPVVTRDSEAEVKRGNETESASASAQLGPLAWTASGGSEATLLRLVYFMMFLVHSLQEGLLLTLSLSGCRPLHGYVLVPCS